MIRFLEDVAKFDQVVCENVVWLFDDAEEIGSSDINCCVMNVFRSLGYDPSDMSNVEFSAARTAVRQAISNLDLIRMIY